ncbi:MULTISPECIES: hypothetical protein [Frankia]|nr:MULTISPECIES: hypothetical protein [Frankia]
MRLFPDDDNAEVAAKAREPSEDDNRRVLAVLAYLEGCSPPGG